MAVGLPIPDRRAAITLNASPSSHSSWASVLFILVRVKRGGESASVGEEPGVSGPCPVLRWRQLLRFRVSGFALLAGVTFHGGKLTQIHSEDCLWNLLIDSLSKWDGVAISSPLAAGQPQSLCMDFFCNLEIQTCLKVQTCPQVKFDLWLLHPETSQF